VSGQSSPDVDRGAADADRLSSDTNRSHPIVCLSAGETTVTVTGDGTGGPNCEYVLAAGRELARRDCSREVAVGAVDTDGLDGSTDAAGGLLDGATVANAGPASSASASAGPTSSGDAATTGTARVEAALADNDALPLLREFDAALEPGPTGTNVDDLRVLVVTRS
jgi:hydroxypyruvate reductase